MLARIVESNVRVQHAARKSVNFAARNGGLRASCNVYPTGAKNDDGRLSHFHASARLCTRIMEKYGASPSSTSASGTIRCSAMVARSI